MTRTFGHKIFKLEGHIKRFYNSLKYIQIDPGLSENEMVNKTKEVGKVVVTGHQSKGKINKRIRIEIQD